MPDGRRPASSSGSGKGAAAAAAIGARIPPRPSPLPPPQKKRPQNRSVHGARIKRRPRRALAVAPGWALFVADLPAAPMARIPPIPVRGLAALRLMWRIPAYAAGGSSPPARLYRSLGVPLPRSPGFVSVSPSRRMRLACIGGLPRPLSPGALRALARSGSPPLPASDGTAPSRPCPSSIGAAPGGPLFLPAWRAVDARGPSSVVAQAAYLVPLTQAVA